MRNIVVCGLPNLECGRIADEGHVRWELKFIRNFVATICFMLTMSCFSWAQDGRGAKNHSVDQLYAEAQMATRKGDRQDAIAKYRAILQADPKLPAAYNNLGMLYCQLHDYSHAIPVLENGLRLDPRMTSAAVLLGMAYLEMHEFVRAREYLEKVVRDRPDDIQAKFFLVDDLINLRKYQEAESLLRKVIARNDNDQKAWYLIGEVYMKLSEAALAKSNAIDPDSALSHQMAGEMMEAMNNYDEALVEYKRAVAIAPSLFSSHEHLANALWAIGKWDSALEEFQKASVLDPQSCSVRWKIANCLIEKNEVGEQALTEVNAAINECPGMTGARIDRARIYIKSGRPVEALPDLHIAERSEPDDPTVHYLLARIYKAQDRIADMAAEMQIYSRLLQSASNAIAKHAAAIESLEGSAH